MGVDSSETSIEGVEVSVAGAVAKRDYSSEPRSLTPGERQAFLEYVEANPECTVGEAVDHVGGDVWRRDIKALRRTDPEFEEDYREARGYGVDQIHAQMVKLAIEGVPKAIVSAGEILGEELVYSERLLQTMFNALTPEGRATLGNKLGIEINTTTVEVQSGVSFEELAAVLREAGKEIPELEEPIAGEIVAETDEPVA